MLNCFKLPLLRGLPLVFNFLTTKTSIFLRCRIIAMWPTFKNIAGVLSCRQENEFSWHQRSIKSVLTWPTFFGQNTKKIKSTLTHKSKQQLYQATIRRSSSNSNVTSWNNKTPLKSTLGTFFEKKSEFPTVVGCCVVALAVCFFFLILVLQQNKGSLLVP